MNGPIARAFVVPFSLKHYPVVQPCTLTLPELDRVWPNSEPSPVLRLWDVDTGVRVHPTQFPVCLFELLATRDPLALRAHHGTQLALPRSGTEISGRSLVAHLLGRPLDADLSMQRCPVEQQTHCRVSRHLPRLPTLQIRVKLEPFFF